MMYILTPDWGKRKTGGQKYNQQFYDNISKALSSGSLRYFEDRNFKNPRISFLYNFLYLKLLFKPSAKILLLDSRMYPRVFLFISLYKLLHRSSRVCLTHHHYDFLSRSAGLAKSIVRFLEMHVLRTCDEIIVPSKYTLDLTQKYFDNSKITFIPLGFEHLEIQAPKKINPKGKLKLLFVGTVCQRKGVHHFVELSKTLKNVNFEINIVGAYDEDDPYYKRLKLNLEKEDQTTNVFFHGRVSNEALKTFFQESSFFVFPSHYEGFGMVVAEAMGYGLPVAVFNNSAFPYLVKHGINGIIVEDRNVTKLAQQIIYFWDNPKLYRCCTLEAIQTYKRLPKNSEIDTKMKEWVRLIESAMKI